MEGERVEDPGLAPHADVGLVARLLGSGDPESVLRRLLEGDPLGLQPRCAHFLRAEAYLIDAERFFHAAAARIAFLSCTPRGPEGELDAWMEARLHEALAALVRDDQEEVRNGNGELEQWDERFEFMTYSLGIRPEGARFSSVAFNSLDEGIRKAFFQLVMVGKTPERCIAEGHGDRNTLREKVLLAFSTLFQAETGEPSEEAQT